jgi:hypothetical protein
MTNVLRFSFLEYLWSSSRHLPTFTRIDWPEGFWAEDIGKLRYVLSMQILLVADLICL